MHSPLNTTATALVALAAGGRQSLPPPSTSLSNVTGVVQGWAGHHGSLLLVSNQTLFPGFPMLVSPQNH